MRGMRAMDISTLTDRFLEETAYPPNTASTYRRGLESFTLFAEEIYGEPSLTVLDDGCLADFWRWMVSPRGRGYSPRTASTYLAAVRRFLQWIDAKGEFPLPFSPIRALHRLKIRRGKRRGEGYIRRPVDERIPLVVVYYDALPLPSPTSSRDARKRLQILRNRAVVHTLYSTAARAGELITLTREQVREGRAAEAEIMGKGGFRRVIFFDEETRRAIRAYLAARQDDNPWLFIPHNGRKRGHIARSTVWAIVKHAARSLGLDPNTSPHSFRHYRAIQLLNEGMPLESVQAFLGHRQIGTTRTVYAPTMLSTLREQLKQCAVPAGEAAARLSLEAVK